MNQPSRPARPVRSATDSPFDPPPAIPVAQAAAPVIAAASVVVQQRVEVTSNGDQLERQLNSIMRSTTVEDLAKKGGPLKTVKEKDLRELIRQSLLQLLANETSISGAEQERILDRVQGELKKKMTAHATEQAERLSLATENQALQGRLEQFEIAHADRAGELGRLRALLADAQHEAAQLRNDLDRQALVAAPATPANDTWARTIDDTWFAGRQRREGARHGSALGDLLAVALQGHVETCRELLTQFESNPPGSDAAGDIVARIRVLLDLRLRDQQWITELQQRTTSIATERDAAHAATEAELQHTIEVETRLEELIEQLAAYESGVAERDELIAGRDAVLAEVDAALAEAKAALAESEAARHERQPVMTLPDPNRDGEISELRDRLDDALRRLEDAVRVRTRVEQDLATAAGGRAASDHRLSLIETQLAAADLRSRELQMQLGDQRKTTDLARLASVEAEALRTEVEGLKKLLHEREHILATERDRAHADRDRHRADGAVRLDALKRVEAALLAMREQLAERDRQLGERSAELAALQSVAPVPPRAPVPPLAPVPVPVPVPLLRMTALQDRSAELAALAEEATRSRQLADGFQARIADLDRGRRMAEAERDALRTHQADRVQLAQERDLLRQALSEAETRLMAREHELDAARRRVAPNAAPAGAQVQAQAQPFADPSAALQAALAPIHNELAALRAALQPVLPESNPTPLLAVGAVGAVGAEATVTDPQAASIVESTPVVQPPAKAEPAKPAQRSAPARHAGPACLGDDHHARYAYLRGSVPRLVVHGATWHHQNLAVTSAAAGSRPQIVIQDGQPWVVYRDRSGALLRASPTERGVLLDADSAVGDPAILVDPAHGRWLIAVRNSTGAIGVHAMGDTRTQPLATCAAQGDPAWWSGGKDGAHRLVVPVADAQVAVYPETAWATPALVSFAPVIDSVAAVAVAGRGAEVVLAVRSASGIVAARRCRRDGTWEAPVVLDAAGAPAIGSLAAAQSDGEIIVAYRSDDGLLQLMLHRGAWRHLAFGANFRAPAAASDPQLLIHEHMIRCFYVGTDDHVHEVRNNSAGWHHYDLTLLARDL